MAVLHYGFALDPNDARRMEVGAITDRLATGGRAALAALAADLYDAAGDMPAALVAFGLDDGDYARALVSAEAIVSTLAVLLAWLPHLKPIASDGATPLAALYRADGSPVGIVASTARLFKPLGDLLVDSGWLTPHHDRLVPSHLGLWARAADLAELGIRLPYGVSAGDWVVTNTLW